MLGFKDLELGKKYKNHVSVSSDERVNLHNIITIHCIDPDGSVYTMDSNLDGKALEDSEGWCIWTEGEVDLGKFELLEDY